MTYLGDRAAGDVIRKKFTTVGNTGVPTAISGGAAAVYKDDSLTQSTAGVTLVVSFDGLTGLNQITVDTSADGAFYTEGSDYTIILTAGTVSNKSIAGYVIADFSLKNRSISLGTDAIDAAALAASAVTEIQNGLALASELALVKTKTDNLPLDPADESLLEAAIATRAVPGDAMILTAAYDPAKTTAQAGDAMALTVGERGAVADKILDRSLAGGSDAGDESEARSVRNALRMLRNFREIVGGVLHVKKENDTDDAWTASVVRTAGDPVSKIDPS